VTEIISPLRQSPKDNVRQGLGSGTESVVPATYLSPSAEERLSK